MADKKRKEGSSSAWISSEELGEAEDRLSRVASRMLDAARSDVDGTVGLQAILILSDTADTNSGTLVSAGYDNAAQIVIEMLSVVQGTADAEGLPVRLVRTSDLFGGSDN